jgi:hypothetical protein
MHGEARELSVEFPMTIEAEGRKKRPGGASNVFVDGALMVYMTPDA